MYTVTTLRHWMFFHRSSSIEILPLFSPQRHCIPIHYKFTSTFHISPFSSPLTMPKGEITREITPGHQSIRQKTSLVALRIWYFLYYGSSMADLYIPLLLSTRMHCSPTQIGLLQALRRVARLLFSPLLTFIGDKSRKHRLLVVICLLFYYLASVVLPFASTFLSVALVVVFRDANNAGVPTTVDAATVAVLENFPKGTTSYGRLRLWGSLGWGVICFIAGFLVDKLFHKDLRSPLFIQGIRGKRYDGEHILGNGTNLGLFVHAVGSQSSKRYSWTIHYDQLLCRSDRISLLRKNCAAGRGIR